MHRGPANHGRDVVRYLSLFSGIEAASVAWGPLGWEPVAFAEIDPFPCAVLAHHWPDVPNLGDVSRVDWKEFTKQHGAIDILIGGSPCQSFSIAGTRTGLQGASKLMFEYIRAVREVLPRYFVWENVPGALSSGPKGAKGSDFGCLLRELANIRDSNGRRYGIAWRVLDSQFFGVPQRRRRVFLIGCIGDAARPASILFESESVRGDYPPSREKRQELTRAARGSFGVGGGAGSLTPWDAQSKRIYSADQCGLTLNSDTGEGKNIQPTVLQPTAFKYNAGAKAQTMPSYTDGTTNTITADIRPPAIAQQTDHMSQNGKLHSVEACKTLDVASSTPVVFAPQPAAAYMLKVRAGSPTYIKDDGKTATAGKGALVSDECAFTLATSQDQTAFVMASAAANAEISQGMAPALMAHAGKQAPIVIDRAAFNQGANAQYAPQTERADVTSALVARGPSATAYEADQNGAVTIHDGTSWVVRRLTPVECERLQGFPDGFTDVPFNGKPAPDSRRYKALGNSFTVSVVRWIGQRIAAVDVLGGAV